MYNLTLCLELHHEWLIGSEVIVRKLLQCQLWRFISLKICPSTIMNFVVTDCMVLVSSTFTSFTKWSLVYKISPKLHFPVVHIDVQSVLIVVGP